MPDENFWGPKIFFKLLYVCYTTCEQDLKYECCKIVEYSIAISLSLSICRNFHLSSYRRSSEALARYHLSITQKRQSFGVYGREASRFRPTVCLFENYTPRRSGICYDLRR